MTTKHKRSCTSKILELNLLPCDCSILRLLLNPTIPFVFVEGFLPTESVVWWSATVPLTRAGDFIDAEVRGLVFDLQLSTAEFLDRIDHFVHAGIEMYQAKKRIPNTLCPMYIPREQRRDILIDNQIVSGFYLPHNGECARYWTTDQAHYLQLLENPELAPFVMQQE